MTNILNFSIKYEVQTQYALVGIKGLNYRKYQLRRSFLLF